MTFEEDIEICSTFANWPPTAANLRAYVLPRIRRKLSVLIELRKVCENKGRLGDFEASGFPEDIGRYQAALDAAEQRLAEFGL